MWEIKTNIKVTAFDLNGEIKDVTEFKNAVMNVGFNMVRDFFKGDVADGEIKYLAVGTSNAAIDVTDTTLTTEIFRKVMTTQTSGATGVLVSLVYIAPAEAVAAIEELGWFAGAAAGAAADSGIMLSRVLYTRNKTALESLQVQRTDTVTEVT